MMASCRHPLRSFFDWVCNNRERAPGTKHPQHGHAGRDVLRARLYWSLRGRVSNRALFETIGSTPDLRVSEFILLIRYPAPPVISFRGGPDYHRQPNAIGISNRSE